MWRRTPDEYERYERVGKEAQAILHDHAIPLEISNLNGTKMDIIQKTTICQIILNEGIEMQNLSSEQEDFQDCEPKFLELKLVRRKGKANKSNIEEGKRDERL